MKPTKIFSKTMPFVWAKLALGMATVLISIVLFAILMLIGSLFKAEGMIVTFVIWLGLTGLVRFLLMHYLGYMVKAGHVAVITQIVTTGYVPEKQVEYGKQMVKSRFAEANVYFLVDKLVSGAVRQIQNMVQRVGNLFSSLPGAGLLVSFAKLFVSISLGYVDECCLGYTFFKREQGAFKSAADGVVIYTQNWKLVLKDALKTSALVVALMTGITLVVFAILGLIFKLLSLSAWIAFILAILIALAIKSAFIDSWVLIRMMTVYMQVAPRTQITFDLYQKLCGISGKFRELFNLGQEETVAPPPAGYSYPGNNAPY